MPIEGHPAHRDAAGNAVPGVPGAHFIWIGVEPMGPTDPAPLVDAEGAVSFGAGWEHQITPHGLFVWRDGSAATRR